MDNSEHLNADLVARRNLAATAESHAAIGAPDVTLSIVSHGHGQQVSQLLLDIERSLHIGPITITMNVPESEIAIPASLADQIHWRRNRHPIGYGANHNAAFQRCRTEYFAVLNPDLRWKESPISALIQEFQDSRLGLAAPAVLRPDGGMEDSARRFPTPVGLATKWYGGSDGRYPLQLDSPSLMVDWVGGMFMLFRSSAYAEVGGFDEKFFLYYEDVDLCARLWQAGFQVMACPGASVVHDARRSSRQNWKYRWWHAQSMLRYFRKHGIDPVSIRPPAPG